jgi:hypothetical protein
MFEFMNTNVRRLIVKYKQITIKILTFMVIRNWGAFQISGAGRPQNSFDN